VHLLSNQNRAEFLSCPALIRFEFAKGESDHEPTLLVKANTLLLKYIVSGVKLKLILARINNQLIYGLKIYDDPAHGPILWSACERDVELSALKALSKGEPLKMFLFNEAAVNVAWKELSLEISDLYVEKLLNGIVITSVDYSSLDYSVESVFEAIDKEGLSDNYLITDIGNSADWNPVRAIYITNQATASTLELFDTDEGGHQENIGIWLTDALHPNGSYQSPQIATESKTRELTDILLSYEFGAFLFESKTLSIFKRSKLPNRKKLSGDVAKHISKAISQLKGGTRQIKEGTTILSRKGDEIAIERSQPVHAIILIPDLSLIESPQVYNRNYIEEFMKATGGFLHMLDIDELLRMVQAAEMIAKQGSLTTPMMAFDYYLMERAKNAIKQDTLCFKMLLRFEDDN